MSWNHRILAHKDGNEMYFQIHEVYYDKEGKPDGYTANGVSVGAESLDGIKWVLDKMKECTNKPILLADDFPNEYLSDSSEFELQRLFDWLQDTKREPAQTKFTSGMTRNVAREFEYLLKHSR